MKERISQVIEELREKRKRFKEQSEEDLSSSSIPVDDVVKLLYQKDELGRLDLSLAAQLNSGHPEFVKYVESNLLRSSMVHGSSCEDVDVAMENVVPFNCQYGNERDMVSQSVLSRFKDYIKENKNVE